MLIQTPLKSHDPSWLLSAIRLPAVSGSAQFWKRALIFCTLLLTTCSSPGFVDTVLFIVTEDAAHGEVTIEPVVRVEGGRLNEPPRDSKWLQPYLGTHPLPLYSHGQLVGRVQILASSPYGGCAAGPYNARLQLSVPRAEAAYSAQGAIYRLASSTLLFDAPAPSLALSVEQRNLLERTARTQLQKLGLDTAGLRTLQLTDAARLTIAGRTVLVGTVSALADSVSRPGATALVVLEQQGSDWQLTYDYHQRFKDIYGQDFVGELFRDAIDLDRDGVPELIFERMGNEVYQYQILKRQDAGWRVIYTGGGGGC
ncbi:hypothetical protein [Gloeobacter kilaueensis]|uniref:Uncharacterized protein n=1 Tax=Gloeobacter kilaueensis (strain ATCC BAA-2537 / CCAP 1431/1 / ULC 316 / JS1) TaxID=1183438 RepID=U5QSF4_GLOK1|nr:hypothetical protein [Gloeobacter kilaueensis]AGY60665.1 hypothetical protein GKIL_4419 [Gloeobacter kilaueensis JS1]